ncbi:spore maturation protein SpmA [Bacillus pakistanensis]|uniref:Spore maturation protein SpmA n=1 Tax=Rossellomorea pakistanensis TaxID=992288 RepID=A0ABS2ND99_9BACI|nr:hypothetical protein [Bacillus pakistanensis]MBM7585830.1 spore maturation protein SpmA [Bacillus pakistanensis]
MNYLWIAYFIIGLILCLIQEEPEEVDEDEGVTYAFILFLLILIILWPVVLIWQGIKGMKS